MNSLSICVPTYNRFKNLDQTLNNIIFLSKNYNFIKEIIVVDNNENDKAEKIIEKYTSNCSILKYIKNSKNIGPEKNFKKCINSASFEYVWLIPDDDLITSDCFDILNDKRDFDLLIANWSLYSNDFSKIINSNVLKKYEINSNTKDNILISFGTKLSFIGSTIFKKELFKDSSISLYDKFIPYQLSFLIFIYSIIDNNTKILFSESPLIKQRGDNDPFLGNNIKNFYNVFSDGIHFFHKQVSQLGYSDSAIKRSFKNSFYYFILRDLINRKVNKDNYEFAFSSSYKNYSHILSLKLILLLIYIIPANLFLFFKTMKKVLK